MNRILCILLIGLGLAMTDVSLAQNDELHHITGFRSALFGMSADEVREAIKHDFAVDDSAIKQVENDEEATTLLQLALPRLEPGPGVANVYYILGAVSKRLMHVNVVWATSGSPDDVERDQIAVAGMQLARYFSERKWKPNGAVSGVAQESGEILLFAGVDPEDSGVEVLIRGVPVTDAEGNTRAPSGDALLRVSYMQRFGQPDVVRVVDGQF